MPKEFLKLIHRDKSAKIAIWQKSSNFAILALLPLCMDFKFFFFSQMTSGWVLWKTYYKFLLKKCLGPCQGPSMYLSERINWIFSSFPCGISKILLDLDSWNNFERLGNRIRDGFFHICLKFETRGVYQVIIWQKLQAEKTNSPVVFNIISGHGWVAYTVIYNSVNTNSNRVSG